MAESSQGGERLMRGVAETLVQARRGRWWCKTSPAQTERRRCPNSICERAGFAWKVMEAEFYVSYSSACIRITSRAALSVCFSVLSPWGLYFKVFLGWFVPTVTKGLHWETRADHNIWSPPFRPLATREGDDEVTGLPKLQQEIQQSCSPKCMQQSKITLLRALWPQREKCLCFIKKQTNKKKKTLDNCHYILLLSTLTSYVRKQRKDIEKVYLKMLKWLTFDEKETNLLFPLCLPLLPYFEQHIYILIWVFPLLVRQNKFKICKASGISSVPHLHYKCTSGMWVL